MQHNYNDCSPVLKMSASATSIRSTGKEFQSLIVFEKLLFWCAVVDTIMQGRIQGGALGAEAPPFIFRLYLINMLSVIMKFCLSIII